jgi:hypothetical protein
MTRIRPTSLRPALLVGGMLVFALALTGCGGTTNGSESEAKVTRLALGEAATAKGANATSDVRVVVEAEEGTQADLEGFSLDDDQKEGTPWYVTTSLENRGDEITAKDPVPVVTKAEDDGGLEITRVGLLGDFDKCELVNVPDPFPAGATNTSCQVFLVPKGKELARIVFEETRFEGTNRRYEWKIP